MVHRAVACMLGVLFVLPVQAAEFFQVRNEALLTGAVSLPVLVPTEPLEERLHAGVRLEFVNEFTKRESADGSERITVDGETYRLSMSLSGRYSERSHWTVRLPVLYSGGGFMDGIIDDWHRFFSLPRGGRQFAPEDRLLFLYERDGEELLRYDDSGTRLGDLEVAWHFMLREGTMLGSQLKLPTGSSRRLGGGGTTGASLWLTQAGERGRWSGFVSAGASVNGRGDIIREQQRRFTPFAGAGGGVQVFDWLRLVTQFYAHPALYTDSDLPPLDRTSLQLAMGGIFRLGEITRLHVLFQEDLGVHASPDFSLQFAVYW